MISIRPAGAGSGVFMTTDRGFTERDLAEVSDSPEWTDEEHVRAVPFATAFPGLAANLAQGVETVRGDAGQPLAVQLNADLRRIAGLADHA